MVDVFDRTDDPKRRCYTIDSKTLPCVCYTTIYQSYDPSNVIIVCVLIHRKMIYHFY